MTEEQILELLQSIRAKRMLAVHYYEEVRQAREANKRAELERRYKTLEDRIASCLNKITENLTKIEGYFGKLSVLKVESM